MYDLFQIKHNIKKNIVFYLFFFVELILCFTLILIGFDENKAYNKRLEIYEAEDEKNLLSVTDQTLFLVEKSLNRKIRDLEQMQLLFGQVYHGEYFDRNGKLKPFEIVEASESFFKEILHIKPKSDTAYMKADFLNSLSENQGVLAEDFKLDKNTIHFGKNVYKIEDKFKDNNNLDQIIPTSAFETGDIRASNTIFLLIDDKLKSGLNRSVIKTHATNKNYSENKLSKIFDKKFQTIDLLADFDKGSNNLAADIRLFGWLSSILVSIVIFGTGSMILIFVQQRKRKNTISYFYGASSLRLKTQLFLEIFSVMFLSLIVSIIISFFVEINLKSAYYFIRANVSSSLILLVLCLIISFLITVSSGLKLEKKIRIS